MKQIEINPSNKPYYSEDFIKGFECGTKTQFEADNKALEQEPCVDAISRVKVKNKAIQLWNGGGDEDYKFSTLIDYITELSPVTPTRKVGKWIEVTDTEFGVGYKCSECGRFILTESVDGRKLKDYPYCHCGAEMRGAGQ